MMMLEEEQISFRSASPMFDGVEDYSHQIAEMIGLRNESNFREVGVCMSLFCLSQFVSCVVFYTSLLRYKWACTYCSILTSAFFCIPLLHISLMCVNNFTCSLQLTCYGRRTCSDYFTHNKQPGVLSSVILKKIKFNCSFIVADATSYLVSQTLSKLLHFKSSTP